jgi:hypothetical protein
LLTTTIWSRLKTSLVRKAKVTSMHDKRLSSTLIAASYSIPWKS